jgi:hypothetical protein
MYEEQTDLNSNGNTNLVQATLMCVCVCVCLCVRPQNTWHTFLSLYTYVIYNGVATVAEQ